MILSNLPSFFRAGPGLFQALGFIIITMISAPVLAINNATHIAITNTVKDFLTQKVTARYNVQPEINIRRLDPRLQLKPCDTPLTASVRRGSKLAGITSVAVSCTGKNTWKIYVQADVAIMLDVVVADTMLERGQVVSEGDLKLESHDIGGLQQGYFDNAGKAAGMIARRMIKPGDLINSQMLKRAYMVKRGESVFLVVETSGSPVQMKGKAMGNAVKGNTVRVKNLSSKRIVEGVATAPGIVTISLN